jgi:hypothetical protein
MRFKRETYRQKQARIGRWHRWFAWFPVVVDEHWAWLEYVERQGDFDDYGILWDYRLTPPKT